MPTFTQATQANPINSTQTRVTPPSSTPRRLLFVVGLTRSGTSLLYALLNQHPSISLMFEADTVFLARERLNAESLRRMEFWNGALRRHGLDRMDLSAVQTPRDLYLTHAQGKDNAEIYGEKSPFYCSCLPRLARQYPDAHFLIVRRRFADVYRSVRDAAQTTGLFNKPGNFHRIINDQERMIRDLQALRAQGAAVHTVEYSELVAHTEKVMRGVADFLSLEFSPYMATLHGSDLSAVDSGSNHHHLRGREICPRKNPTAITPRRLASIERLQQRWDALEAGQPVPFDAEFLFHHTLGRATMLSRQFVRGVFEYAPMPLLIAYRQLKRDFGQLRDQRPALLGSLSLALTMVFAIMGLDWFSGPGVTLAPFYLLPGAFLVRRVNTAVAVPFGFFTAVLWSLVHPRGNTPAEWASLFMWNTSMRFLLLALFVLLLGTQRAPQTEAPAATY